MTQPIEINFHVEDFELPCKWYSMLFKDKHPSKKDQEIYYKLQMLAKTIKEDEEAEDDGSD